MDRTDWIGKKKSFLVSCLSWYRLLCSGAHMSDFLMWESAYTVLLMGKTAYLSCERLPHARDYFSAYSIVFHFVYYGMWICFDHDCSCCSLSQVLVLLVWLVTPCLVTVCLVTRSTQLQEWNLTEKVCICSPFVYKLITAFVGEMRHLPPRVIGCLCLIDTMKRN